MNRRLHLGLRARLVAAMAAVAVASVALATLLANRGLDRRLSDSTHRRLQASAEHMADVARDVYLAERGWTKAARKRIAQLAPAEGLRVQVNASGTSGRLVVRVPVTVDRRTVGRLRVTPADAAAFAAPDRDLHDHLNRLHLLAAVLAGGLGVVAAILLAVPLARPLQRLTEGARRIEEGDLSARVRPTGGAELEALGRALNHLAATLGREEQLRKQATENLAHELRTPLTGIISRIEAAQDGVLPDAAANLDAMHAEALRLQQLLADLDRLAEAQQPAFRLTRTDVDLGRVAAARTELVADAFADKGIALAVDVQRALVRGDEARLAEIVDNLLTNALRYTDRGGRVAVGVAAGDGLATLAISDSGIGLSADEVPHVFERFWRSDKSRARSSGGAGIGLAIVRELVRAHDGTITVASTPGAGSTFTVTLPLAGRPG